VGSKDRERFVRSVEGGEIRNHPLNRASREVLEGKSPPNEGRLWELYIDLVLNSEGDWVIIFIGTKQASLPENQTSMEEKDLEPIESSPMKAFRS